MRSKNHFLPQSYLKAWSNAKGRVWVYQLLVSHPSVPEWKARFPAAIAYHRHLYTRVAGGSESDDFERWLDKDFEAPAAPALAKIRNEERLTRADWVRIGRFVAAQDVRTPARYVENRERWIQTVPSILDNVMEKAKAWKPGPVDSMSTSRPAPPPPLRNLPFKTIVRRDGSGQTFIKAEVSIGRSLWISSMELLLTRTVRIMEAHRWSILKAPRGTEWPTSDDPVVRLNYYRPGEYDFKGGWGNKGAEILLPISPRHLLYTRIGHGVWEGGPVTPEMAAKLRKIIVEKASRAVICSKPNPQVVRWRARTVSKAQFEEERRAWETFAEEQRLAELDIA